MHAALTDRFARRMLLATLAMASVGSALAAGETRAEPATVAASAPAPGLASPLSAEAKMSYATGVMTARNLMKNEIDFDVDLLIQGLRDELGNQASALDERELKKVLQQMQTEMQRHLTNERRVKASVNRERGQIFQKDYAKKPGTVVLPGNLMYRVIKAGTGERPSDLSTVVVSYAGRLVDGTAIDRTADGKTVTVHMNQIIPGWREALKQMNAGSKWEIVVPPPLAYGVRGSSTVGPNETVVYELELVAVAQP